MIGNELCEDGKVYRQSRKCPKCISRNVTPIQYSYIVDPDAIERIDEKKDRLLNHLE
mgnify:CR=1 FL=1|jgi:hypothetical protein